MDGWLEVSAVDGFPSPILHLVKAYIPGPKEDLQLAMELEHRYYLLFVFVKMADAATVFPINIEELMCETHILNIYAHNGSEGKARGSRD